MMTTYRRAGVASTFSPTFAAVLAEAESFARHCGADLEIIHAAEFDAEKERRFRNAMGQAAAIRWVSEYPPAQAIISAARDYDYELVIAGALQVEDGDRPFTSSVARELMRDAPCDILLVPRPLESPDIVRRVVFALEPGENVSHFLSNSLRASPARACDNRRDGNSVCRGNRRIARRRATGRERLARRALRTTF